MVSGQEVGEILWEMVRSLENSYDLDRMTPGHLYRTDLRNVYNQADQLAIGSTIFKLFAVKMSMSKVRITPRTLGSMMFYAGYSKLMQPDGPRPGIAPSEFIDLKTLEVGLEILGPEFHEQLMSTIDRMLVDGRMKADQPEAFGTWCWALGQRYGEYRDGLDAIEKVMPSA